MKLTDEQLRELDVQGFLIIPNAFSREEVDVLRAQVPMLLEEFYPEANSDDTANGNVGAVEVASHNAPQSQVTRMPQRPQPRRSPLTNKLGKGDPSPPQ